MNLTYRNRFFAFLHDVIMILGAWVGAYWLRYNLSNQHWHNFFAWDAFPVVLIVQTISFYVFGLYRGVWRFASMPDLIRIIKSVLAGVFLSILVLYLLNSLIGIPRSVFILYGILLVMLLGGPRLLYRWFKDQGLLRTATKRVLVVGAGQAGEAFIRDASRDQHGYRVVAFVDDDKTRLGREIHGVRVLGRCKDISSLVKKIDVDMIVIAIPSATASQMRRIVEACEKTELEFRTMPSVTDITTGKVNINSLRNVSIEDLLGREPVTLDWDLIHQGITGKKVLISGGGGSIGSELCHQVAKLAPSKLIVIENNEYNLYQLERVLLKQYPKLDFRGYLIDVTDRNAVKEVLEQYKPGLVFHAAAYKHVPLLEHQARAAIRNNIMGTAVLAEESEKVGAGKFVLISTDKAVNPTNVMGASKRVAELVCQNMNKKSQATQFIITRFGNVLGSRGSVIPLFQKQLEAGGPITVTHPDITRFFMTIPEASQLILQTAVMGGGGEIFVLDMGEPIKISYLAEQLIRLSGKKINEDIEIVYTGLRPGEKLYEELFYQDENLVDTQHKKIFRAISNKTDWEQFQLRLAGLDQALDSPESSIDMKKILEDLVPKYNQLDILESY